MEEYTYIWSGGATRCACMCIKGRASLGGQQSHLATPVQEGM